MKGKKMSELMTGIKTTAVIPKTYGWYEFRQNNSGGSFQMDDEVTVHVLIQAASAREADIKAEDIGIYFDGVRDGCDCDCCGDRWHRADDAMESFTAYAYRNNWTPTTHANVRDYAQAVADEDMWAKAGTPYVILYFADGTVERFFNTKKGN